MTTLNKTFGILAIALGLAASAAAAAAAGPPHGGDTHAAGYGRCYRCNCRSFQGSSSTCGNCGHNYSSHY